MAVMGMFFLVVCGVLIAGSFFLWIAALYSCLANEPLRDPGTIVWLLLIVFTHFLGAFLYFIIRRPQRIRELGR